MSNRRSITKITAAEFRALPKPAYRRGRRLSREALAVLHLKAGEALRIGDTDCNQKGNRPCNLLQKLSRTARHQGSKVTIRHHAGSLYVLKIADAPRTENDNAAA